MAVSSTYGNGISDDDYHQRQAWVIPVIVVSVIFITGLLVFVFIFFARRSEYIRAREKEPYLTRSEFAKRRKLSEAARLEEEEKQRIIMIRKSLASRSWDSAASNASSRRLSGASGTSGTSETCGLTQPEPSQQRGRVPAHRAEFADDDDDEPRPLREDWKAWEARMQSRLSLGRHPAAEPAPELLPPRQMSRSRALSPSHSPLLAPRTPPVPPRNPNRNSG